MLGIAKKNMLAFAGRQAGPSHDMAMPRVRTALSPTMLADVLQ